MVRLTDHPDMTLDVYRGRKTTTQQQQQPFHVRLIICTFWFISVPLVLKSCTDVIETHGLVDGIYRLSGITSNIQKLR